MTLRRRIILALAVGPLLTVLVAWTCWGLRERQWVGFGYSENGEPWLDFNNYMTRQGLLRDLRVSATSATCTFGAVEIRTSRYLEPLTCSVPPWADQAVQEKSMHFTLAAGWPWLSLRNASPYGFAVGTDFNVNPYAASSADRVLNLRRPIFAGFLYTSFFWSIAAFALLSIPASLRHVRRAIRRRRGQCAACGYARTGLSSAAACPECGQSRATPS